MARQQLAVDMVGYAIMELDVVFDGARSWRVQRLNPDGTLHAVDAHAWTEVTDALVPNQIVRVRAERFDDMEYMQSVWRQCHIIKEFLEE
ncbi:MAG: hypothetical protein ABI874_03430 [Chloroflexota bacterium]